MSGSGVSSRIIWVVRRNGGNKLKKDTNIASKPQQELPDAGEILFFVGFLREQPHFRHHSVSSDTRFVPIFSLGLSHVLEPT